MMTAADREEIEAELGYRHTGAREVRMREWMSLRGDPGEAAATPRAFRLLVGRLSAKRWWKNLDPQTRARIRAYRKLWAQENRDRYNQKVREGKRRWIARKAPGYLRALAAKRDKRYAAGLAARGAGYTCVVCEARWCRVGHLATRFPPLYCTQACASRAAYVRARAAGKPRRRSDRPTPRDR